MRLLRREPDGSLSFTPDLLDDIPPYAILSHTWGADDQEVTFRDIQDGTGLAKDGYKKLTFCARQAAEDNLEHFWVDTCCIDKANHTELSEAINSMFRWYKDAVHCYVYLTDVSKTTDQDDCRSRSSWKTALRQSRYFTRGWTLQELIAPRSVRLFSAQGESLGDKTSLQTLLHEITGVPNTALEGNPLSSFSISDRFSWLGSRRTKRPEDRAYCMFGIFDVHLPLIYGEGEDKALARLRQEIGRDTISETGKRCIADLRVTDPHDDKKRIQETKGGLLEDSYVWILENPDFVRWRDDDIQKLLWVKGDPGKGKTMLLCGIIDQMQTRQTPSDPSLAYFFCQATDERINTALSVLRGLIFMLLAKNDFLLAHIEKKYEASGRSLFEDANAWQALCTIFTNMLQDERLSGVRLVIDALDECTKGLPQLLDLVVKTSESTPAQWLVSSRNWAEIEETLCTIAQRLSLEVNAAAVEAAVDSYITHKVKQLAERKRYRESLTRDIRDYLLANAAGTFLWVALICQELESTRAGNVLRKAKSFPAGLDALYGRMLEDIDKSEDANICMQVLALVTTAFRPISIAECATLLDNCHELSDDVESVQEIVASCGSFLTNRNGILYFVHQSAKDFLATHRAGALFPAGQPAVHGHILVQSLDAMQRVLHRDMYRLESPGCSIADAKTPEPDPLASVRYSCVHWLNHLFDALNSGSETQKDNALYSDKTETFLRVNMLCWIEALTLLRDVLASLVALKRITSWERAPSRVGRLVRDAYRLLQTFRPGIQECPLQIYVSALVFSPSDILARELYIDEQPQWLRIPTKLAAQWSACEATLEGHVSPVATVFFSADDRQIISSAPATSGNPTSSDAVGTVKIWDAFTGECLRTISADLGAFSTDRQRIALASGNRIEVRNATATVCDKVLLGHDDQVMSLAFSANGSHIISGSKDNTIRVWNAHSGACEIVLRGAPVTWGSVSFSLDGILIASAASAHPAQVWRSTTGKCELTLPLAWCAAMSPDGRTIAVGRTDGSIEVKDTIIGGKLTTLTSDNSLVRSIAFSPDGRLIASISTGAPIKLWDVRSGKCIARLEGHYVSVTSASFSSDGKRLVSSSEDKTIRIWDATANTKGPDYEGHENSIRTLAFSRDGRQAVSATANGDIHIWDSLDATLSRHIEQESSLTESVATRWDGTNFASASKPRKVKVYNTGPGTCERNIEYHMMRVNSTTFSPDGVWIVSADGKTAKIWKVIDTSLFGSGFVKIQGHDDDIGSAVFSQDGRTIITIARDTAKLWNAETAACIETRQGIQVTTLSRILLADRGIRINSGGGQWDDTLVSEWAPLMVRGARQPDYQLSLDGCWLLRDSRRLLWIPPDYRPSPGGCFAAWADARIAIVAYVIEKNGVEFPLFFHISV
ncbi:vegetative incompatibility protein HET-E-1 [Microdochium bolleyi]|uniref:Vegetative incompatibility protein HET-E-1 n=1 Tax=Microdochium bolleyi TaxID=196109 RepID=A0A136IZW6_9PEZI|nr:vegetative incompatibility protein HET-E-1 [Microdochium bolleyi]